MQARRLGTFFSVPALVRRFASTTAPHASRFTSRRRAIPVPSVTAGAHAQDDDTAAAAAAAAVSTDIRKRISTWKAAHKLRRDPSIRRDTGRFIAQLPLPDAGCNWLDDLTAATLLSAVQYFSFDISTTLHFKLALEHCLKAELLVPEAAGSIILSLLAINKHAYLRRCVSIFSSSLAPHLGALELRSFSVATSALGALLDAQRTGAATDGGNNDGVFAAASLPELWSRVDDRMSELLRELDIAAETRPQIIADPLVSVLKVMERHHKSSRAIPALLVRLGSAAPRLFPFQIGAILTSMVRVDASVRSPGLTSSLLERLHGLVSKTGAPDFAVCCWALSRLYLEHCSGEGAESNGWDGLDAEILFYLQGAVTNVLRLCRSATTQERLMIFDAFSSVGMLTDDLAVNAKAQCHKNGASLAPREIAGLLGTLYRSGWLENSSLASLAPFTITASKSMSPKQIASMLQAYSQVDRGVASGAFRPVFEAAIHRLQERELFADRETLFAILSSLLRYYSAAPHTEWGCDGNVERFTTSLVARLRVGLQQVDPCVLLAFVLMVPDSQKQACSAVSGFTELRATAIAALLDDIVSCRDRVIESFGVSSKGHPLLTQQVPGDLGNILALLVASSNPATWTFLHVRGYARITAWMRAQRHPVSRSDTEHAVLLRLKHLQSCSVFHLFDCFIELTSECKASPQLAELLRSSLQRAHRSGRLPLGIRCRLLRGLLEHNRASFLEAIEILDSSGADAAKGNEESQNAQRRHAGSDASWESVDARSALELLHILSAQSTLITKSQFINVIIPIAKAAAGPRCHDCDTVVRIALGVAAIVPEKAGEVASRFGDFVLGTDATVAHVISMVKLTAVGAEVGFSRKLDSRLAKELRKGSIPVEQMIAMAAITTRPQVLAMLHTSLQAAEIPNWVTLVTGGRMAPCAVEALCTAERFQQLRDAQEWDALVRCALQCAKVVSPIPNFVRQAISDEALTAVLRCIDPTNIATVLLLVPPHHTGSVAAHFYNALENGSDVCSSRGIVNFRVVLQLSPPELHPSMLIQFCKRLDAATFGDLIAGVSRCVDLARGDPTLHTALKPCADALLSRAVKLLRAASLSTIFVALDAIAVAHGHCHSFLPANSVNAFLSRLDLFVRDDVNRFTSEHVCRIGDALGAAGCISPPYKELLAVHRELLAGNAGAATDFGPDADDKDDRNGARSDSVRLPRPHHILDEELQGE